jgi:hypothetical protein
VSARALSFRMLKPRMPADLAVAQATFRETTLHRLAHLIADWLKRLSALGPKRLSGCPAAWELTGITRIDRYDAAPWLSF